MSKRFIFLSVLLCMAPFCHAVLSLTIDGETAGETHTVSSVDDLLIGVVTDGDITGFEFRIEVMPNRNLYVRGEKRIGINQGYEYVRLSGIVRPKDITPENTVQSTRIADPTISYVGEGALADANSMGWLTRFFNSALSPF